MAIDIAGFITYLKDHAVEHGFHVHDERHFIETYSLRQSWEMDLHPENACDGPLDLQLAFDVEPRVLLALEDRVSEMDDEFETPDDDEFRLPLLFNWALPPLKASPDLLVLATDVAGIGGLDLPIEVSGQDTFGAMADSVKRLAIHARVEVSLVDVMLGQEKMCDVLDRCREVSEYLLERADGWIA